MNVTAVIWEFTSANTWSWRSLLHFHATRSANAAWKSYECFFTKWRWFAAFLCSSQSNITAIKAAAAENWHIFALKGREKKRKSHRMLKIHHICLDLLVSEAVSNLSPSVVDSASLALKKHLGKLVHCCTNAWVFAHKCNTLIYLLTRTRTLDIVFLIRAGFDFNETSYKYFQTNKISQEKE